jgi:hypothetical protein
MRGRKESANEAVTQMAGTALPAGFSPLPHPIYHAA